MSDHKDQLDHDLDRLLHALATAAPPPLLEQHTLAALAQQAEEFPAQSAARAWWPMPRWAWAATAAAFLVATALVAAHRRTEAPANLAGNLPAASPSPVAAPAALTSASIAVTHHAGPRHHATSAIPVAVPAVPELDPAICHCDPVAMAEAAAPSHPAPPMPLTREERRILRLLRDGQYQQVASLNDAKLERDFARSRAEFDAYFPPPPPPPSPPDSDQGTPKP